MNMKFLKSVFCTLLPAVFCLTSPSGWAAGYPAPQEGSWVVRDFRFHTGETLPELRLHYTTVGDPAGEPVVPCNTTTGSPAGSPTVV